MKLESKNGMPKPIMKKRYVPAGGKSKGKKDVQDDGDAKFPAVAKYDICMLTEFH